MDNTTLPLVKIIPPIQQPTDSDLLLIFFHILFMTFGICGNISQISIQIYHRRFRRKSPVQILLAIFFFLNAFISLGAPYVVLEILSKQWSFSRATCQFSEITGQIGRTLVPYTISAIFLATGFPEIFAILPGFLMSVLVLVLLILLRVGESAQLESHLLGQAIRANNNTIMFEIFQCTVPFRAQIYTPGLAAIIELVVPLIIIVFSASLLIFHQRKIMTSKILLLIYISHFTTNVWWYFLVGGETHWITVVVNLLPYVNCGMTWILGAKFGEVWWSFECRSSTLEEDLLPNSSRPTRCSTRSIRSMPFE